MLARDMQPADFLTLSLSGFKKLSYHRIGKQVGDNLPIICAHGFLGCGKEFLKLASKLSETHPIFCPDFLGRGESEHLEKAAFYHYMQSVNDAILLMAAENMKQCHWIGTSMGGIIGLLIAAQKNSPIQKLVLNDIGPYASRQALLEVFDFILEGDEWASFTNLASATKFLQDKGCGYWDLNDREWADLARILFQKKREGHYHFHFDPQLKKTLQAHFSKDLNLWNIWGAVKCPVLVLRGKDSKVLTVETAEEMMAIHPNCRVIEVEDASHAPNLIAEDTIQLIADFLQYEKIP